MKSDRNPVWLTRTIRQTLTKIFSRLTLNYGVSLLLAMLLLCPGGKAEAQLAYTLNNNGLATLSYNGVSLMLDGTIRLINSTPFFIPDIGQNGNGFTPTTSTLSGSTVSQTYPWGTSSIAYSQNGSTLNMIVKITNTTTSTMTGANVCAGILQFPVQPTGSTTDSLPALMGSSVLKSNPMYEPPVVVLDYGTGAVDFCNENVSDDGVTAQGGGCWNLGTYTQYSFSADIANLGPGQTKTAAMSYRFGASGTGDATATDIYGKYSAYYPFTLQWADRRMIGTDFLAASALPHPATNPRGWFLNDVTIDTTTQSGITDFRSRMMSYADLSISELRTMNCQGVIFWDMEGQQYPQPAVSYVGDPRLIPTFAPEMEYDDGTGKTDDVFIKKFTDAGLKIGFTLRPQVCDQSTGQWNQNQSADIVALLNAKIAYAVARWGATLFYVDSNVDQGGNLLDPSLFEQLANANPNVLIIPEHHTTRYYSSTMGFGSFVSKQITNTIPGIYNVYPGATSFVYAPTDGVTTLVCSSDDFEYGCSHGDLLSFHGWYNDVFNPTVLSIFNTAGMGPTAKITSPTSGSNQTTTFTINATASAAAGKSISKVDFYQSTTTGGTVLLGTDTTSPYSFTWTNPPGGSYILTVKATDSAGLTRTPAAVLVTVGTGSRPVITSPLEKVSAGGAPLTYTITASGSPTSYGATPLPAGLSVNTGTGVISGTPTVTATINTLISATNAQGTGSATLVFYINPAAPVITSALTAGGTVNVPFTSYTIKASNNPVSYTAAPLPAGLSLNAGTGVISGTPTTAGTTNTSITATNAGGTSSAATLAITINTYNINAIYTTGTVFSTGGLDNFGDAYVSSELGASCVYNGSTFTFAPANAPDGYSNQTIALPPGAYPLLNMVGTAAGGIAAAQTFTVNYTDGTNQPFTINMHDWTSTSTYAGETKVTIMAHRLQSDGTLFASNIVLHGYTFTLNGKVAQSITLPAARGVVVLGFAPATTAIPVITSALSQTGPVGSALSYTITATNSPTSYGATPLPAGLTVNTATGVISGTTTAGGKTNTTISATNAIGTGSAVLSFNISPPIPVITSALTQSGTTGAPLSYYIMATNSPTSFNAAPLPDGLCLNTQTGRIWMTPNVAGTTNTTISATNSGGTGSATLVFTITQAAGVPAITSPLTQIGYLGVPLSYTITASNSPTSYAADLIPGGFSLNTSTGVISGTPILAGTTSTIISAINAAGTGSATLVMTLYAAPVITSGLIKVGWVGVPFVSTVHASNNPAVFGAAPLPSFLSFDTIAGVMSGTPTTTGTFNIVVSATNPSGTGSATLVLTVSALAAPVINSGLTAVGAAGSTFSYSITATGGATSFGASPLPAGISVNTSTGVISGTPTTAGATNVTMSAINAAGTGTAVLAITINTGASAPVINSGLTASGQVGSPFSYTITATNSPTSFGANPLPLNLALNTATGLISGTPTLAGTTYAAISATNAGGTASVNLVITITSVIPVITGSLAASGTVGTAFSYAITATNSPTSFSATPLPAGLSVNTGTGLISGTPTAAATTNVTISATSARGTGSATLVVTIHPGSSAPVITSSLTASGTVGTAASYTITATNSPTSYGATNLPAGLSVNTGTGAITGTPTTPGIYSVGISATNAGGTGSATLTYTINNTVTPYNVSAIYTSGQTFPSNGGLDSFGNAYLASQLGASCTYNGGTFTFGPSNSLDAWANTTVNLPAGSYTSLDMTATSSGGIASGQTFQVNYTDGTNQQFTIQMKDWTKTTVNAGETIVVTMANCAHFDGTSPVGTHVLHGYTFTLNGNSVKSITLPAARGIVAFGFRGH